MYRVSTPSGSGKQRFALHRARNSCPPCGPERAKNRSENRQVTEYVRICRRFSKFTNRAAGMVKAIPYIGVAEIGVLALLCYLFNIRSYSSPSQSRHSRASSPKGRALERCTPGTHCHLESLRYSQRGSLCTMHRHRAGQGSNESHCTVHVLSTRTAGRAGQGSNESHCIVHVLSAATCRGLYFWVAEFAVFLYNKEKTGRRRI